MAKVKYVDNKPTLEGDDDAGKLRIFGKTLDEMRSNRRNTGETFPSKFTKKTLNQSSIDNLQPTTGSRVDFSDEKMGPNFRVPKKITKEIGILILEITNIKCGIFLTDEIEFSKRIENFLTIFLLIIYSEYLGNIVKWEIFLIFYWLFLKWK